MKTILRIALVLLLMAAGVAWATDGKLEQELPTPQVEQPEQVEPETEAETQDEEVDIEKLLSQDKVDVDACCFAECDEVFQDCTAGCGGSWPCFQDCRAEFRECTSHC